MDFSAAVQWIKLSARRARIVTYATQPMTVQQLARNAGLAPKAASRALWELALADLAFVLNSAARSSRVYWLRPQALAVQRLLREEHDLPANTAAFPVVDWSLYGRVSTRHRAAVLNALDEPLQPAAIKRRARFQNPKLRASANNLRDATKVLAEMGVVEPVREADELHARFRLTPTGRKLQELLRRAETVPDY